MSQAYLRTKIAGLVGEVRQIRKEEYKVKKWEVKTKVFDGPPDDNQVAKLNRFGWKAKVVVPPPMTVEQRQAHRQNVWKVRAKMRRLNKKHDADAFWKLREHRMKLRPIMRACHLAYGYLKGLPYATIEGGRDEFNLPPLMAVWAEIEKFGQFTEDNIPIQKKNFEAWYNVGRDKRRFSFDYANWGGKQTK